MERDGARIPAQAGGDPPGEAAARPEEGAAETELTAALRRAKQGDEGAFRILYRTVNPELVRYLRVIVGDDAEDVASEAWLQISRDLLRFKGDGPAFRRFALVVARNRARDLLRRARSRVREVAVPGEELPEPRGLAAADAAETALETLSTERAIAFIGTLPREQAEAVMLRVVLGMDSAGAGEVLGKRPGAVRMAVSRGLRTLGRRVEQQHWSRERGPAGPVGPGGPGGHAGRSIGSGGQGRKGCQGGQVGRSIGPGGPVGYADGQR